MDSDKKKTKGHISIEFKLFKEVLVYSVEDDGIGREKALEILHIHNKNHKSLSTNITRERINILNKRMKRKIIFKIEDLKTDLGAAVGTRVVFEIPAT